MSSESAYPGIRKIRQEQKMTQAALATKANIHWSYVSLLESGARTNPTIRTLVAIAQALDVPMSSLTPTD